MATSKTKLTHLEERFVLKASCCGVSLRTGTLIIALLNLICCEFQAIRSFIHARYIPADSEEFSGPLYFGGSVNVIGVLLSLLLLFGVIKGSAKAVILWVWVQVMFLLLLVISGIIIVVETFDGFLIVYLIINVCLNLYFIAVAHSYSVELRSEISGNDPS